MCNSLELRYGSNNDRWTSPSGLFQVMSMASTDQHQHRMSQHITLSCQLSVRCMCSVLSCMLSSHRPSARQCPWWHNCMLRGASVQSVLKVHSNPMHCVTVPCTSAHCHTITSASRHHAALHCNTSVWMDLEQGVVCQSAPLNPPLWPTTVAVFAQTNA